MNELKQTLTCETCVFKADRWVGSPGRRRWPGWRSRRNGLRSLHTRLCSRADSRPPGGPPASPWPSSPARTNKKSESRSGRWTFRSTNSDEMSGDIPGSAEFIKWFLNPTMSRGRRSSETCCPGTSSSHMEISWFIFKWVLSVPRDRLLIKMSCHGNDGGTFKNRK